MADSDCDQVGDEPVVAPQAPQLVLSLGAGPRSVAGDGDEVASLGCDIASNSTPKGANAKKPDAAAATFECTLCHRNQPIACRVPGHHWDRECKRAYDALRRLAVKQKEMGWWEALRSDPKQMKKALFDYMKQCPSGTGRGKLRAQKPYKITELKERLTSRTTLERQDIGQMMWEEQYYRWAESVEGGLQSRDTAQTKWAAWSEESSGVVRDRLGPQQKPLRLRVIVRTEINTINAIDMERTLERSQGAVRNASEQQTAQMREQAMRGHDSIMGMHTEDIQSVAENMVGASGCGGNSDGMLRGLGGTGAFDYEGISNIDLRQNIIRESPAEKRAREKGEKEAGKEGAASTDSEDGGAKEQTPTKKAKKAQFFKRDQVTAAKATAFGNTINSNMQDAKILDASLEEAIQAHSQTGANFDAMKLTLEFARGIRQALGVVFVEESSTAESLNTFLDIFKQQDGQPPSKPPPIQKIMDLEVAAALRIRGQAMYKSCMSQAEVKEAGQKLKAPMSAIQELITVAAAALMDIKRAKDGSQRLSKLQKKLGNGPSQSAAAAGTDNKVEAQMWELMASQATPIPTYPYPLGNHDKMTIDYAKPFILTGCGFSADGVKGEEAYGLQNTWFKGKFESFKQRTGKTRGGRAVKDETLRDLLTTKFSEVFRETWTSPLNEAAKGHAELVTATSMQHFGIAPNLDIFSTELEKFATLRIAAEGGRSVVMADFCQIAHYMVRESVVPDESAITIERMLTFLQTMTEPTLKAFTEDGSRSLWFATLGPHDMLYTPAGFGLGLQTQRQQVLGYTMGVVVKTEQAKRAFNYMHKLNVDGDKGRMKCMAELIEAMPMPTSPPTAEAAAPVVAGGSAAAAPVAADGSAM